MVENERRPEDPRYDVAISFLVQDLALAQALYDELIKGFSVFFFPHNQEELAGTDGLESMRQPFFEESRVNVVLYREKWGNTPWTRVEATAIKEACLQKGWDHLFFLMVDPASKPPIWLPKTQVRFNYGDFSLDQAIGAIKLRVQEQNGHYTPLTPLRKAELIKAEELYRQDKAGMRYGEGISRVLDKVRELLVEAEKQCAEVSAKGDVLIEHEIDPGQAFVMRHESVGMIIRWHQRYANSLDDSGLTVTKFKGRLRFNSEMKGVYYHLQPEAIGTTTYEPDMSRSREIVWKLVGKGTSLVSSVDLAQHCVLQFMEVIERAASGKLSRPSPF